MQEKKLNEDRRRAERKELSVDGRLMTPAGEEFTCSVLDISLVGIALSTPAPANLDDKVIIYLNDLGRFEGKVVRMINGGFCVEIHLVTPRRERVAERIRWLFENQRLPAASAESQRQFPRITPKESGLGAASRLILPNGERTECRVLDMSLSGAHLKTDLRPPIDSRVQVGRMTGRVVRHTPEGIGVHFDNLATELPTDASHLTE
ncbi:type IV pilus assembly PilZ [Tepidicaulis marinus]|jgi:hypothetical protein|uniref:Type IV pilus assembly PilZ n=1 Tax=Tepidicaulis marinus TaxID=1333998 RepID=A0A081BDD0_9HYPH|nr:type IV pilus assembly PilZ [Tepidicaulis marinus]